jgi:hypothetical protein
MSDPSMYNVLYTSFPSWRSHHSLSPSGPSRSPHSGKRECGEPAARRAVAGLCVSERPIGCHDTASQPTDGESLSPYDPPTTLSRCGLAYLERVHLAAVPPTASDVMILARSDGVSPSPAYNALASAQQLRLLLAIRTVPWLCGTSAFEAVDQVFLARPKRYHQVYALVRLLSDNRSGF